jgi:hypothetical protein
MTVNDHFDAWLKTLDWPSVGPKLLRALEDVDWALSSDKPDEAEKIVDRVFAEIGRTQAELATHKGGRETGPADAKVRRTAARGACLLESKPWSDRPIFIGGQDSDDPHMGQKRRLSAASGSRS